MAKNYDIGKKSDINKLAKDIKQKALDEAKSKISSGTFDIKCPHCGHSIKARKGKNTCPYCNDDINLGLDFKF